MSMRRSTVIKKGFIAGIAAYLFMLAEFILWSGTSVKVQKLAMTEAVDVVKRLKAQLYGIKQ